MVSFVLVASDLSHAREVLLYITSVSLCAGFLIEPITELVLAFLRSFLQSCAKKVFHCQNFYALFHSTAIRYGMLIIKDKKGNAYDVDITTYKHHQLSLMNAHYRGIHDQLLVKPKSYRLAPPRMEPQPLGVKLGVRVRVWAVIWTMIVIATYILEPKSLFLECLPSEYQIPAYYACCLCSCLVFIIMLVSYSYFFLFLIQYKKIYGGSAVLARIRQGYRYQNKPIPRNIIRPHKKLPNCFGLCVIIIRRVIKELKK